MPRAKLHFPNRPGFFLVIEGPDGSGKTTLARRLIRAYRSSGWVVCPVREPGGTKLSERVRRLVLDVKGTAMGGRAEMFLYLAARAQLVDDVIRPALARGEMVIADRFSLSTYAYQSAGRGLPLFEVAGADQIARNGLVPELTIVLMVSEAEAQRRLQRLGRRPDRIERESQRFHRAVNAFYERWGRLKPQHVLIDARVGADEVFREAKRVIEGRLRRLSRVGR